MGPFGFFLAWKAQITPLCCRCTTGNYGVPRPGASSLPERHMQDVTVSPCHWTKLIPIQLNSRATIGVLIGQHGSQPPPCYGGPRRWLSRAGHMHFWDEHQAWSHSFCRLLVFLLAGPHLLLFRYVNPLILKHVERFCFLPVLLSGCWSPNVLELLWQVRGSCQGFIVDELKAVGSRWLLLCLKLTQAALMKSHLLRCLACRSFKSDKRCLCLCITSLVHGYVNVLLWCCKFSWGKTSHDRNEGCKALTRSAVYSMKICRRNPNQLRQILCCCLVCPLDSKRAILCKQAQAAASPQSDLDWVS